MSAPAEICTSSVTHWSLEERIRVRNRIAAQKSDEKKRMKFLKHQEDLSQSTKKMADLQRY